MRSARFLLLSLVVALVLAIGTAFAQDVTPPPTQPPVPEPTQPAQPETSDAGAQAPTQTAPKNTDWTTSQPLTSGLAPMPGNGAVPEKLLPPGAFDQDRGPSTAIFPPQKMTLRFNHKFHVVEQKMQCKSCHVAATTSESAMDHLTPRPATCDGCHGSDHEDLGKVKPGEEASGKCNFCHVGYKEGDGNVVAHFEIPRPNMVFNHKKHAARNINCQQCHGDVQELELATRDQLPRMRGCFNCHARSDSAAGDAKSACENCHIKGGAKEGGRLKTVFATGTMQPPRWLHNAQHGADFVQRHKYVAANDSQFCSNCHKEDFCVGCHDGRVRPRNIHPNDYLNMHAVEARLAMQKCTSCHREQSFCLQCHQRLGVSMSGPVKDSGRFHPPKADWSDPPRRPGHHAYEAMRNLNACVSCHIERDCVICHGGKGVGAGFNPHRGGFASGCSTQFRRNPRPCYVCHEPGAPALAQCR